MEAVVKLNRKLGVGSRGVVYEGFDHVRGHFVAIKELAYMEPSLAGEEDAELAAILRELAYMREAQHPNLVEYYGARRSTVGIQIIMEYVSGGSLDYVLTRCGPVREAVARAYTRDVLEALHYLHEVMHVCHRDVKPANILITPDGRCKLADFGVAKHVGTTTPTHAVAARVGTARSPSGGESPSPRHRSSGQHQGRRSYLQTAVGTPWYMAPEVINGGVEDDEEDEEDEAARMEADAEGGGDGDADDASVQHAGGGGGGPAVGGDSGSSEDWAGSGPARDDPHADRAPLYSSTNYYNPLRKIVKKGRLGARSVGYTTSADIWSVGVTVYEMVTGRKPFGADLSNPSAVLFRIANCAASPPRLPADVHVSPELHSFLDLCFVYDKDLRATAGELLGHAWLRGGARQRGGIGGGSTTATEASASPPRTQQPPSQQQQQRQSMSRPGVDGARLAESGSVPRLSQQQQQIAQRLTSAAAARRTVFDGVPLLDAIDLPAYPAATALTATTTTITTATSPASSDRVEGAGTAGDAAATSTPANARLQPSVQRLSCSGTHRSGGSVPLGSPAVTSPLPSTVSVAEHAEASSRYAAVRQRIGRARSTTSTAAAASPPPPPPAVHSSAGGLWSTHGEFVDLLSHP